MPTSMRSVTSDGDLLEKLQALALKIADKLDDPGTDSKNIASLARQYRETINQIADLSGDDEGDAVDDILSRRADNR